MRIADELDVVIFLDWSPGHLGYVIRTVEGQVIGLGQRRSKPPTCTNFDTIHKVQTCHAEFVYHSLRVLEAHAKKKYHVTSVVLEGAAFGGHNRVLTQYHQSCGAFLMNLKSILAWDSSTDYSTPPTALKKWWTGTGKATKEEMLEALKSRVSQFGKNPVIYTCIIKDALIATEYEALSDYVKTYEETANKIDPEFDIVDALALTAYFVREEASND